MFLGISIIGWAILVATYMPVALLLKRLARGSGVHNKTFIAAAVLTSLPFVAAVGEAAYVEHNWRVLCASAKAEVKRKVVVEGFYDDGYRDTGWKILQGGKDGFRFVEWKDKEGRIWRTEGFNEPELRTVQIAKPTARFQWHRPLAPTPKSHLVFQRQETVTDLQTGEVIASNLTGYRRAPFIDRIWRQWFDAPPDICGTRRDIWSESIAGIDRKGELK